MIALKDMAKKAPSMTRETYLISDPVREKTIRPRTARTKISILLIIEDAAILRVVAILLLLDSTTRSISMLKKNKASDRTTDTRKKSGVVFRIRREIKVVANTGMVAKSIVLLLEGSLKRCLYRLAIFAVESFFRSCSDSCKPLCYLP